MHAHADRAPLVVDDVPPLLLVERRQTPDRRETWRGGRRDSDWISRPPGALTEWQLRTPTPARWRSLLTMLHLW